MKNSAYLGIRVPLATIQGLDSYLQRQATEQPGVTLNRSDLVRSILSQWLKKEKQE